MNDSAEYWRVYDWIRNAFPYDNEDQIERKVEEYINRNRQEGAGTPSYPKHNTT